MTGGGPIPDTGRVLGLDLGSRRVGVAVSDGDQRLATAVTVVARSRDPAADRRRLAALAAEYDAVGVVVGLPRSLSGATGPAARQVLDEIPALSAAVGTPIETIDERMTTVEAAAALRASGKPARAQRAVVDQIAAALLLQHWLDRRSETRQGASSS